MNFKLKWAIYSLVFLLVLAACSDDDEVTDPEQTMGKVGNYWSAGASGYDDGRLTITQNSGGDVVGSLTFEGDTYTIEGKVTDNAIYDYVYSNGDKSKPFTLVKFDANVGDKWEFNVGNQKVVREVVRKSTEDDVEYGFWLVKTIDVKETIPTGTIIKTSESEVKEILWQFNHKFGFISATIKTVDGKTTKVNGYSTNAAD
ncbi:hypothetical protein [uncultured Draconibacterium sp.]|uniref:hypothetical protein n=1 Tax=uncultured Draconibacterium sp. TaxID=1573823 RepID=UPI0029C6DFDD|nr:hypothetical protein [uncultured Draconibacterium sp.]